MLKESNRTVLHMLTEQKDCAVVNQFHNAINKLFVSKLKLVRKDGNGVAHRGGKEGKKKKLLQVERYRRGMKGWGK